MTKNEMHLTKFIAEEQVELAKFERWWREEHSKNPDHFPLTMAPGEWWEQFMMWCETGEGR